MVLGSSILDWSTLTVLLKELIWLVRLQFGRARGEDRFYNSVNARRAHQNLNWQSEQIRRAQSDVMASHSHCVREKSLASRELENRTESNEPSEPPPSNLKRFLKSITPSVPAQYLSKPYFELGDLWESFKEWSAYGAGVPLILNDSDSVVQYYVPYLSGIQIYEEPTKSSTKLRQRGEDSDNEYRDSSSDGSSDCELERGLKYTREQRNHHHLSSEIALRIDRLSLRDQHVTLHEEFSSDEGESVNSQGCLLFEYLEWDLPHSREPLADKIADLACRFPELKTLRSCDLLSCSWISVAWYCPLIIAFASRIPTGPTLKDLDACFLTYHSLYTPVGGSKGAQALMVRYTSEIDGVPKMSLPVCGLASYKFKGSLWMPSGGFECQLANSLLQEADNWLRLVQVNHPDFLFFSWR
ncbi:hypothetical protein SO802_011459 [Lithocarpus litseifolius]|uniref:Uncharacterized protein n=1 Tax=Lithocarpus litseifolius TaxID=425828 RepID=A0AAW2D2D9_9ROSI